MTKKSIIVLILVLISAVLMIAFVPFESFKMVNPIVNGQLERIAKFKAEGNPKWPLLTLTPWLVSFFYPFWGTLSVLAGIALFVIAKPLYEGKEWARGGALLCLAIPSMGGAYMIVPWMNFIGSKQGGFPPAVTIMMIGLVSYFAILLLDVGDWKQKLVDFLVFLMLGVTAAESFANGHAAFRVLYGHPKRPIFAPGISITYFAWIGFWVAMILLVIGIYQLGTRKESGWYLTMIGGAIAFLVGAATHYVRHATNDYLFNSLMGLSLVVMLLIPLFKERLLHRYGEEEG